MSYPALHTRSKAVEKCAHMLLLASREARVALNSLKAQTNNNNKTKQTKNKHGIEKKLNSSTWMSPAGGHGVIR